MGIKILTIGAYGFDETQFFETLKDAGVDLLCDIRWRRGVRGSQYAFVNHKRLKARLESLGIAYIHRKDLAPTPEIRQRQKDADQQNRIAKRERASLSPGFIQAYQGEILASLDPQEFIESLPAQAQTLALFCVEREPMACHRLLLAEKLREIINVTVEHLLPGDRNQGTGLKGEIDA